MSAAGENNYPGERDENPMVYKRVDSRLAFSGGFYKHVLQCPQGYKATGGGFDFNARNDDPTGEGNWSIVANFTADEGKNWVVEAHRSPKSSDKTFTAYALCAPEELLPGVVYEHDSRSLEARYRGAVDDVQRRFPSHRRRLRLPGQPIYAPRPHRARGRRSLLGGRGQKRSPINVRGRMSAYRVCVPTSALD